MYTSAKDQGQNNSGSLQQFFDHVDRQTDGHHVSGYQTIASLTSTSYCVCTASQGYCISSFLLNILSKVNKHACVCQNVLAYDSSCLIIVTMVTEMSQMLIRILPSYSSRHNTHTHTHTHTCTHIHVQYVCVWYTYICRVSDSMCVWVVAGHGCP